MRCYFVSTKANFSAKLFRKLVQLNNRVGNYSCYQIVQYQYHPESISARTTLNMSLPATYRVNPCQYYVQLTGKLLFALVDGGGSNSAFLDILECIIKVD